MTISNQAAQEVKNSLEQVLIEKLKWAIVIDDLKDKSDEYARIQKEYYGPFKSTCDHLGVSLEKFDDLDKKAAKDLEL